MAAWRAVSAAWQHQRYVSKRQQREEKVRTGMARAMSIIGMLRYRNATINAKTARRREHRILSNM